MGPTISAGSMADIAFLLLIFFLTTTTLDTEFGLMRLLPPPIDPTIPPPKIKKRNVLEILVNYRNDIMVEGEIINPAQLKEKLKEFIMNRDNKEDLPEKIMVTKQICQQEISQLEEKMKNDPKNAEAYKNELGLWKE